MPKPLPPELRERLGKLLPLLSSDKEGEVNAAVAAITTLLTKAGLDWHDLTAIITGLPPLREPPKPASKPKPTTRAYNTSMSMDSNVVEALVDEIYENSSYISDAADDFLGTTLDRAKRYPTVLFTERQWAWFVRLVEKATGELLQPDP